MSGSLGTPDPGEFQRVCEIAMHGPGCIQDGASSLENERHGVQVDLLTRRFRINADHLDTLEHPPAQRIETNTVASRHRKDIESLREEFFDNGKILRSG